MDEGFLAGTHDVMKTSKKTMMNDTDMNTLSHWRVLCTVEPPRPIPNRVVKHGSVEGTSGLPAGRLDLCAIHMK